MVKKHKGKRRHLGHVPKRVTCRRGKMPKVSKKHKFQLVRIHVKGHPYWCKLYSARKHKRGAGAGAGPFADFAKMVGL